MYENKPSPKWPDLSLTSWQPGSTLPTVPGTYEALTGGGHIFERKFDGKTWRSSVNNEATTLAMPWRGVVPGSIEFLRYESTTRLLLMMHSAGGDDERPQSDS